MDQISLFSLELTNYQPPGSGLPKSMPTKSPWRPRHPNTCTLLPYRALVTVTLLQVSQLINQQSYVPLSRANKGRARRLFACSVGLDSGWFMVNIFYPILDEIRPSSSYRLLQGQLSWALLNSTFSRSFCNIRTCHVFITIMVILIITIVSWN